MIEEVKIPEISENVESGTVVNVMVAAGDPVEVDDPIIELETDKAVVEIPTPYKGKIAELLVAEGDEVKIGQVVAKVDTAADEAEEETGEKPDSAAAEKAEQPEATGKTKPEKAVAAEVEAAEKTETRAAEEDRRDKPQPQEREETRPVAEPEKETAPKARKPIPASPSVRRLARELGVNIEAVQPGEPGGRLTEADIKAHVKRAQASTADTRVVSGSQAGVTQPQMPDFSRWGDIETIELDTVRRLTSQSVSVSWQAVPHVTQFDAADITQLQAYLQANKKRAQRAGGKLTLTPVLMKACAEALLTFPRFNASIDPDQNKLILKHYVHIGLMVDTPRGLLVPVVRDANTKSIIELAVEIADLADRARNKKVKPDELEGGTFSISNQGGIGGTGFTPIVLWPQVAVLGMSRTTVEPRHRNGAFEPRDILPLSLSYDHRIIDGADAARFLRRVCESLEYPMAMHIE